MDKYKWHDLRKNPKDLPLPMQTNILVLADWNEFCKMEYGIVDFSTDGKWCIYNRELDDIVVYAWKEIEPFEVAIDD